MRNLDAEPGYGTWVRNLDTAELKSERKAQDTQIPGFHTWIPYLDAKAGYETRMRNPDTEPGYRGYTQRMQTTLLGSAAEVMSFFAVGHCRVGYRG